MRDFISDKYRIVFRLPVLVLAAIFMLAGCSPKVDVALSADSMIQLSFTSGTGKTVAGLYFSTLGVTEAESFALISDTSELKHSLQNLGFSVAKTESSGADIAFSASAKEAALSSPASEIVSYGASGAASSGSSASGKVSTNGSGEKIGAAKAASGAAQVGAAGANAAGTAGKNCFSLTVTTELMQALLSQLPEETAGWSEMLMAPLFTGEEMSEAEYAELLGAVYGNKIVEEAANAAVTLCITVPAAILETKTPEYAKVSVSKNAAKISIPLLSFLTECNAVYSVIF